MGKDQRGSGFDGPSIVPRGGTCDTPDCERPPKKRLGAANLCYECFRAENQGMMEEAARTASALVAEIRVSYGDGAPQHVEPSTPVPTRPVERLRVRPEPAPEPAEPRQRKPRPVVVPTPAPVAELALVTSPPPPEPKPVRVRKPRQVREPKPPREPKPEPKVRPVRAWEIDPAAAEGQCRRVGCVGKAERRGLCAPCRKYVTKHPELSGLLLPASHQRNDRRAAEQQAQLLAVIRANPGMRPVDMCARVGFELTLLKNHLRALLAREEIVRDGRGMYRTPDAKKVRHLTLMDRFVQLVRSGVVQPWLVRHRLNITVSQATNVVTTLRKKGILRPYTGDRKRAMYELVSP